MKTPRYIYTWVAYYFQGALNPTLIDTITPQYLKEFYRQSTQNKHFIKSLLFQNIFESDITLNRFLIDKDRYIEIVNQHSRCTERSSDFLMELEDEDEDEWFNDGMHKDA
jgi:hypothetical protein